MLGWFKGLFRQPPGKEVDPVRVVSRGRDRDRHHEHDRDRDRARSSRPIARESAAPAAPSRPALVSVPTRPQSAPVGAPERPRAPNPLPQAAVSSDPTAMRSVGPMLDGSAIRKVLDVPSPELTAVPTPHPVLAVSEGQVLVRDSGFPPTETLPPCITEFNELPIFNGLLSQGEEAVYRVNEAARRTLVAIDLGGMACAIVRTAGLDDETRSQTDHQYKALVSQLKVNGYSVTTELVATEAVMQEILQVKSQARRSRSKPMDLFRRWIQISVQEDASDIHVEILNMRAQVRIRVGSELQPLPDGKRNHPGQYTRAEALDAVSAAYNDSREGGNSPNYVEKHFIDTMMPFDLQGSKGWLRFQNLKGRLGPKVVIRILRDHASNPMTLATAGYAPSHLRQFKIAWRSPRGLMLIAGSVNSGKSTTQACFLTEFPNIERRALYTIEDPIEYELGEGVHQIEVLRDLTDPQETKKRYGAVYTGVLRGDPCVLAVGEIRDGLTANFALSLAQSGQMVMGTLHANGIPIIVPRLTEQIIGLSLQSLTNVQTINTLVFQALLPLLCLQCNLPTHDAIKVDPDVAEFVELLTRRFRAPLDRVRWRNPTGCAHCAFRGTRGRTVVAEVWQPDRTWLDLVRQQRHADALDHYRSFSDGNMLSENMDGKTAFEHALYKALNGLIDVRSLNVIEPIERFHVKEAS